MHSKNSFFRSTVSDYTVMKIAKHLHDRECGSYGQHAKLCPNLQHYFVAVDQNTATSLDKTSEYIAWDTESFLRS